MTDELTDAARDYLRSIGRKGGQKGGGKWIRAKSEAERTAWAREMTERREAIRAQKKALGDEPKADDPPE